MSILENSYNRGLEAINGGIMMWTGFGQIGGS